MKAAIYSLIDHRPTQLLKGDGVELFFALLQLDTDLFTLRLLGDTVYADIDAIRYLPTLDEMDQASDGSTSEDQGHGADGSQDQRPEG